MSLNIDIYLRTAFQELDAFSIPGIGTFRKVHRAAQVDEGGLRVLPPMAEFEYEEDIHASLLLNKYLIDHIQLDIGEAEEIVSEIKDNILESLHENSRFEMAQYGILTQTESGKLQFIPYGLGDDEVAGEYFGLRPVSYTKSKTIPVLATETTEDMKQEPHIEPARSFQAVGWKSATLVLLLGALGFMLIKPQPFYQKRSSLTQGLEVRYIAPENLASSQLPTSETTDAPVINEPTEDPDNQTSSPLESQSIPNQPTQERAINPSVISQPQSSPTARLAEPNPTQQTRGLDQQALDAETYEQPGNISALDTTQSSVADQIARKSRTRHFHLVTGSFESLKSANLYASQLRKRGQSSIILMPAEGSSQPYRVSVFRNASRNQVQAFANKWKSQGNEVGWIYEEK